MDFGAIHGPGSQLNAKRMQRKIFGATRSFTASPPFGTRIVHQWVGIRSTLLKPKGWLPGMGSNHDSRLQRPLSYH